jgi:hypothetical protein
MIADGNFISTYYITLWYVKYFILIPRARRCRPKTGDPDRLPVDNQGESEGLMNDVMKWWLILIGAGVIYFFVSLGLDRFELVGAGGNAAYKMDRITGKIWLVGGTQQIPVKEGK